MVPTKYKNSSISSKENLILLSVILKESIENGSKETFPEEWDMVDMDNNSKEVCNNNLWCSPLKWWSDTPSICPLLWVCTPTWCPPVCPCINLTSLNNKIINKDLINKKEFPVTSNNNNKDKTKDSPTKTTIDLTTTKTTKTKTTEDTLNNNKEDNKDNNKEDLNKTDKFRPLIKTTDLNNNKTEDLNPYKENLNPDPLKSNLNK